MQKLKFSASKITMLEDTARAESSQIGAVERAHRTCDSQLRALRLGFALPLVPFLEQVMIRFPIDPPGYRKRLESQWLKDVRVSRVSDSDANVVVHPEGIIAGKSERRLAPENRHDAELYNLIGGAKA